MRLCPRPSFFRIASLGRGGRRLARRLAIAAAFALVSPAPAATSFPDIPADYLRQAESIPDFWVSEVDAIERYLATQVKRGQVEIIGHTAGGRPIRAVSYGKPRQGRGTTTFSGSLGFFDVRAYLGPDYAKKVFVGMGGVHGGEFEGIVGVMNLISVLETGHDLRGKAWPGIVAARDRVDRIVLIPVVNVDGRARVPLRMEPYLGTDNRAHVYFNTGVWKDGKPIGWPTIKEFIPLDFSRTQFPGGYPNDAGVNIQHDDFLGDRQPETQALLDLVARERPDLMFNMHTGAPPKNYFVRMHRPATEAALLPTFDDLYRAVHTALTQAGLQSTKDVDLEAAPPKPGSPRMNLDTALNFHCGALAVLIEAPSHSFAGVDRAGEVAKHTPEMLVDAHLVAFEAGLTFLADRGGRAQWAPK
ncbi:MAG TPA: M14 family zinc carboxypeptidase [Opitutus sp.]|nr:M14 family zinc carboxypeptidase [Opitutus sp.]